MRQSKFGKMVLEFPFLTKILAEKNLAADSIGSIEVMRGDRNLLEVAPSAWAHDAGEHGDYKGYRSFWYVTPPCEVGQFKSSWHRSIVPHGTRAEESASPIGCQLLALNQDVLYIVETHSERWDHEDETPNIVIYKMQDFAWRAYARPS